MKNSHAVYKDGNRLGRRKARIELERRLFKSISFGARYGSSPKELERSLSMMAMPIVLPDHSAIHHLHAHIGGAMGIPREYLAREDDGMSAVSYSLTKDILLYDETANFEDTPETDKVKEAIDSRYKRKEV